jgi:hypothetical protein
MDYPCVKLRICDQKADLEVQRRRYLNGAVMGCRNIVSFQLF